MDRHNSAAASSNYSLTVKIYAGTGEWGGLGWRMLAKLHNTADDEDSPWPQSAYNTTKGVQRPKKVLT